MANAKFDGMLAEEIVRLQKVIKDLRGGANHDEELKKWAELYIELFSHAYNTEDMPPRLFHAFIDARKILGIHE